MTKDSGRSKEDPGDFKSPIVLGDDKVRKQAFYLSELCWAKHKALADSVGKMALFRIIVPDSYGNPTALACLSEDDWAELEGAPLDRMFGSEEYTSLSFCSNNIDFAHAMGGYVTRLWGLHFVVVPWDLFVRTHNEYVTKEYDVQEEKS